MTVVFALEKRSTALFVRSCRKKNEKHWQSSKIDRDWWAADTFKWCRLIHQKTETAKIDSTHCSLLRPIYRCNPSVRYSGRSRSNKARLRSGTDQIHTTPRGWSLWGIDWDAAHSGTYPVRRKHWKRWMVRIDTAWQATSEQKRGAKNTEAGNVICMYARNRSSACVRWELTAKLLLVLKEDNVEINQIRPFSDSVLSNIWAIASTVKVFKRTTMRCRSPFVHAIFKKGAAIVGFYPKLFKVIAVRQTNTTHCKLVHKYSALCLMVRAHPPSISTQRSQGLSLGPYIFPIVRQWSLRRNDLWTRDVRR